MRHLSHLVEWPEPHARLYSSIQRQVPSSHMQAGVLIQAAGPWRVGHRQVTAVASTRFCGGQFWELPLPNIDGQHVSRCHVSPRASIWQFLFFNGGALRQTPRLQGFWTAHLARIFGGVVEPTLVPIVQSCVSRANGSTICEVGSES